MRSNYQSVGRGDGQSGSKTAALIVAGLVLALLCLAMGKDGIIILSLVVALLVGSMLWDRWHNPPEAPGFRSKDEDD